MKSTDQQLKQLIKQSLNEPVISIEDAVRRFLTKARPAAFQEQNKSDRLKREPSTLIVSVDGDGSAHKLKGKEDLKILPSSSTRNNREK